MHIRLINLELRSSQRLEAAATAALFRSLNYGLWVAQRDYIVAI